MGSIIPTQSTQSKSLPSPLSIKSNPPELQIPKKILKLFEAKDEPYNQEQPYFIVLVGPSQSGKSSFLKTICTSDAQKQTIGIGDNLQSCTSCFGLYEVENQELFGSRGAVVLDSIGFGDTSGEFDDVTILSLLHCKIINASAKIQMRVDAILLFQSCKQIIKVRPLIQDIILCFGEEAAKKYTAVCLTKRNALTDEDEYEYEDIIKVITDINEELGMELPTIDLFTSYYHRKQKKDFSPSKEQEQKQIKELKQFLQREDTGLNLYEEWRDVLEQGKILFKAMYESDIQKKVHEIIERQREQRERLKEKPGFFDKILVNYRIGSLLMSGELRQQAVREIDEFYEQNGDAALKLTEVVLTKKIAQRKQLKSASQIDKNATQLKQ